MNIPFIPDKKTLEACFSDAFSTSTVNDKSETDAWLSTARNFFMKRAEIVSELVTLCKESGRQDVPEIVAVTKAQSAGLVSRLCALDSGLEIGENRVKVAKVKIDYFDQSPLSVKPRLKLPSLQSRMHFIGRLQTNDVKAMLKVANCIHSVDRVSLAQKLEVELQKQQRAFPAYLQVDFSGEETKTGFSADQAMQFLTQLEEFKYLRFVGLMTMATNTDDEAVVRECFSNTRMLAKQMQQRLQAAPKKEIEHHSFRKLSMGMSGDYRIAVSQGATVLRLGSILFG